jgi:AcrR family transcriptional regulator
MVRPKRSAGQTDLQEAIKDTAWKQIADFGAPALSLRAIARELGITAPAIYNYYARRDDLVTALVIDAFTSFGDSQLAARDSVPGEDLEGRLLAIGLAYRNWALAYPQRYQLIFGTPIPGYEFPMEAFPASARSITALFSVVENLYLAGHFRLGSYPPVQEEHEPSLELWRSHVGEVDPPALFVAMSIWARVHGVVSLEIQGNILPFGDRGDALYMFEMESIRNQFFQEPPR